MSMNLRPVWAPEPCLKKRKRKTFEDELIKSLQGQTVEGRLLAAPSPSFEPLTARVVCVVCAVCLHPLQATGDLRQRTA